MFYFLKDSNLFTIPWVNSQIIVLIQFCGAEKNKEKSALNEMSLLHQSESLQMPDLAPSKKRLGEQLLILQDNTFTLLISGVKSLKKF